MERESVQGQGSANTHTVRTTYLFFQLFSRNNLKFMNESCANVSVSTNYWCLFFKYSYIFFALNTGGRVLQTDSSLLSHLFCELQAKLTLTLLVMHLANN